MGADETINKNESKSIFTFAASEATRKSFINQARSVFLIKLIILAPGILYIS